MSLEPETIRALIVIGGIALAIIYTISGVSLAGDSKSLLPFAFRPVRIAVVVILSLVLPLPIMARAFAQVLLKLPYSLKALGAYIGDN